MLNGLSLSPEMVRPVMLKSTSHLKRVTGRKSSFLTCQALKRHYGSIQDPVWRGCLTAARKADEAATEFCFTITHSESHQGPVP